MNKVRFPFPKNIVLNSRKEIGELFAQPDVQFNVFPILVLAKRKSTEKVGNSYLTSVSKRSFKKAVDRNRIKRVLREAIRLQFIPDIQSKNEQSWNIALIFIGKRMVHAEAISQAIRKCVHEFDKRAV